MTKIFSIYRSSAGSGKTRTLAREYLRLALRFKADYFKYILAVTFTNKASQEMKDRILAYLDDFARGNFNELAEELKAELGCDEQTFQQHSQAVQSAILHQYDRFSISTIDAFFQKVIRSFTRESGLVGDYRLEVEHDAVLEQVIDNLIDELGNNAELTSWVVDFARENLENERAWDVRYSLIEFAREIFREEFKEIEDDLNSITSAPGFFKDLKAKLWNLKQSFLSQVSQPAQMVLDTIAAHGWSYEDFSYGKNSGLFSFLSDYAHGKSAGKLSAPGERVKNYYTHPANWPNKKSAHAKEIVRLAAEKFVPALQQILDIREKNFSLALSAELALKNLYVFGLIADIARKLKEYKDENNLMLLADAPKFLNGVIRDSDTPFIYEKVGSFYRNYLIDEFQDTSGMQWKNFQPLIANSLDQGYPALVVGDVKQAIYRWRGGDLDLLQQKIAGQIGDDRVDIRSLKVNFRSAREVVSFNNALFSHAARIVAQQTVAIGPVEAYADIEQQTARQEEGFVQVRFIRESWEQVQNGGGGAEAGAVKWNEIALEQVPLTLERLQELGVALKDIAILVRKNDEGQRIANYLLHYKNSGKAKPGWQYDVVSNESLRIDGASTVNLLLGAMRYLLNPDDSIARAQLGYEFARLHEPERELHQVFSVTNQAIFENNLPEHFTERKPLLKKLPLVELAETLIEIFSLGRVAGELVYLQAFQDLVLDFSNRERNDLAAFLEWWETNRHKKSVQISGEVNAVQILTIHKSKGLQFRYVILPFCSWSMDHETWQAPNLWVKSEHPALQTAGYLPVKYGKVLEQTLFDKYYRDEHTRTNLDNLNLLYVAFTRAETGLIVTAPHPEVRQAKNTVAALLYDSIHLAESLKAEWNEAEACWSSGEWRSGRQSTAAPLDALQLPEYLSSSWREKLVIRTSGSSFFADGITDARRKINYGIHMHAVLSRLRYADGLEDSLKAIVFEGLIAEDEVATLRETLRELLRIPEIDNWFSRDWTVHTEIPVLLPGGEETRLDRLIHRDKKAIVIDFKTGARKKTDQDQVLDYIRILRQMNFTEVDGYLLYLTDNTIVDVKPGTKHRVVQKQKSKDQLSLGF